MPRHHELTGDEFAAAMSAAPRPFVLDVRSAEEFQAAHVPGSASIHVHEIAQRRSELPTNKIARILVVGDGGKRTTAAAAWLVLMGYADVGVLAGGFAAWTGPVEKGPPPPPKPRGPQLRVI
jgi:rhodanese-related sulfurtransferase